MSQQNSLLNATEPIGGHTPRALGRNYPLFAKDFTSVEQAVPLRLVYGQARVAAIQITPIFGFRNEQIPNQSQGGK
jgi:hypothetical protein